MPVATSSRRDLPASTAHVAAVTGSAAPAAQLAASAPNLASGVAAQKAVETVLSLTERFASSDKHSVNLQFSIGGSDLQVRVELRADEVRTAFRTESSELRAALAHEWQTVNPTPAERSSIRFADPVFASSSSGDQHGSSFSSDTASQQQRESAARREAMSLRPDFSRAAVSTSAPAAAPRLASASSGPAPRLSTFA